MDRNEREAVLSLVPHFSEERVVFDVGSNMGEWADILIHNCEMRLFEPNIKLLNYTQIKYRYLRNVEYRYMAIGAKQEYVEFNEFQDEYNGLSSIYVNEKWADLPQRKERIMMFSLDSLVVDYIDLLKIDVEGAEWDVIQGAENLLREKKIKFIQFEYSEHYKVPGYTGQQIIDFVKPFGYHLYDYDGTWKKAKFEENYERKNYYLMQEFTENWNAELKTNTEGMTFSFALEIGCFEGLSSCYICDMLLKKNGRMICIDPLEDRYLTKKLDAAAVKMNEDLPGFKGQYGRFMRNTKGKPIELLRMTSMQAFQSCSGYDFDFIYIDGDHREKSVNADANLYFTLLHNNGGVMLFDDYTWSEGTRRGIDKFLIDHQGQYKILASGYQLMIQKWI